MINLLILISELEKEENPERLAKILGTRSVSGYRYIKAAGKLHNSKELWQQFDHRL